MSFDLFPQVVIIISIGIIVIILGKNVSKIKNPDDDKSLFFQEKDKREKDKFFYLYGRIKERINKEEYRKKIDLIWVWLEKTLRKIRISFLKIDNKIVQLLFKLKEKQTEIEIDKNEQIDNVKNMEKGEKIKTEEDKSEFKQEKTDVAESKSQKIEVERSVNNSENAKFSDKEKQEEMINNISAKEDAKGKEKEYIKMILKNPIDIKAYWNLGIVYSRRKNYNDAVSCFRQITKIDPTYFKAKKKISDLIEKMKSKNKDENKDKEKSESENINIQKEGEKNAQFVNKDEK